MLEISEFIGVCGFQNVRRKADGNYNFRCTICGDSQKSKTKKRAWLLYSKKTSQWMYYCFNCGASLS